jgi:hypothetical protein
VEYEHLLPEFAASHQTPAYTLLAAGMPVNARGEHGGTALHWACWKGYADLLKLLIDAGASLTIEDHCFQAAAERMVHSRVGKLWRGKRATMRRWRGGY